MIRLSHILPILCVAMVLSATPLPKPAIPQDATLAQSLQNRHSNRQYSGKPLSDQELSNLLWAAYGNNRPGEDKLTVPAALNRHAFTLYVVSRDAVRKYLPLTHSLETICEKDLLGLMEGRGTLGPDAGTAILLTMNPERFTDLAKPGQPDNGVFYLGVEAGAICQDIYLYCAATGLSTVCCGSLHAIEIQRELALPANQKPVLTMIVGHALEK